MAGIFISFEGIDGSGKTTQITKIQAWLQQRGHDCLITREPGGTQGAEAIRNLVMHQKDFAFSPAVETALLYAARKDHVEKIIKPALQKGIMVLCDRFHDSSLAYQGGGRKLDAEWIMKLHLLLLNDFMPDLTFYFDIDPKQAHERREKRNHQEKDVFESTGYEFMQRVKSHYDQLASLSPQRIITINASQSREDIFADLTHYLDSYLENHQHV